MRIFLLLVPMLLGACETAMFRHAPSAAGADCPAGIAGDWQDKSARNESDIRVSIDGDCVADIRMLEDGAWVEARAKLHFHGEYLFVASTEVAAIAGAEAEHPIPDGYFAWRFALAGDTLELADPDARRLAHLIIDREIKGRLRKGEGLEVMVEEPPEAMAELLDRHRPFIAKPTITLHRAPTSTEPVEE